MKITINKIFQCITNPHKILLFFDNHGIIHLHDKLFISLEYKNIFNKRLNLDNPQTFNEKIQWLKLYDRKDIYTKMVDKYEAKNYVASIIGEQYIIPTLAIYNKWEEIDFNKLPNSFVIKCTHDSGGLCIVSEQENFNIEQAKKKINKCLKNNYFYNGREWPYKNVKPRIIIEKYLGDNINDYKIFCFNGEPKFILVCSNRNGLLKNTDFYDIEWNLLPFTRSEHTNNPKGIMKPKRLDEMIEISKVLSKDIPFVRVDLYDIQEKIFFGELTFYPSSGFEGFKPTDWDKKIGDMLDLSMVKKNEK